MFSVRFVFVCHDAPGTAHYIPLNCLPTFDPRTGRHSNTDPQEGDSCRNGFECLSGLPPLVRDFALREDPCDPGHATFNYLEDPEWHSFFDAFGEDLPVNSTNTEGVSYAVPQPVRSYLSIANGSGATH